MEPTTIGVMCAAIPTGGSEAFGDISISVDPVRLLLRLVRDRRTVSYQRTTNWSGRVLSRNTHGIMDIGMDMDMDMADEKRIWLM